MAIAVRRNIGGDASIGDVKYSYLSEAQFISENGPGWVLDDGRSIVGSKLHAKYGFTTTKDARGVFLRGKNNGRSDVYADPGGERAVGGIQGHSFQTHTHVQNPHDHSQGYNGTIQGSGSTNHANGSKKYALVNTGQATAINQNASATGAASEPTSQETRPTNICFNVFLKIN